MKICQITWEFPPRVVGGIASHVHDLSKALVRMGHEVYVVTLDFPGAPNFEEVDGVKVYRAPSEVGHPHFLTWTLLFNHSIEKRVADVGVDFDVLHVHDWLTAPAGIAAKHFLRKPLVTTIHSTEYGRSTLHSVDSMTIDGLEWWATYEANKVIVTTWSMRHEVCGHFKVPWDKVWIIPNAVDAAKFQVDVDKGAVRQRYGVGWGEKLILYVGRLVPQKGVEYLIQAVPKISAKYPGAKFVIVGEGWLRGHLEWLANQTGQRWRINFTGFIPDSELVVLMRSADVLVVPSVYEPFGIVALEGMAAGVPVVASQVGGLAEVVEHDRTGVYVYMRNPDSIAWGVDRVLSNSGHAEWLVRNGLEAVRKVYSWEAVAKKTTELYEDVVKGGAK
ncbi:MAG: glycosyltransferase family 4 protein [Candidatus Bathyarchaeia archaeon]|nr:glycosyltransferase family 4 protein [Candidatus Bathyarchaeota archaeon A05DMB-4]MDH7595538.1 glycosyltransferase family 4 protein [Candidatus Bathyarchaeota archaeon]